MDRLRLILEKYSRWQLLIDYVNRIELSQRSDFSFCIENSKSLLESIAKQICKDKKQPLEDKESMSKLLRLSFGCLGHNPSKTVSQIGQAIATIGQQMGEFRNEIGETSHGRTLDELRRNREEIVNSLTGEFFVRSTEIICCFLIEAFETDNPLAPIEPEIEYDGNPQFNEYWDDVYGEFEMTEDYIYPASKVLFNVDPKAYKSELSAFNSLEVEADDKE